MAEAVDFDPLERLESLLGRIEEEKKRRRLGGALDAAVRAAKSAESAIARMDQLAGFTVLVSGFLDQLDKDQCRRLLSATKEVGQFLSCATDVETLWDAANRVSQLPGQIDQLDQLMRRGWKAKIDEAFSATGRLGGVLREIPETRQLGAEMEALIRRAEQLGSSLEDAEQSAKEFDVLTTDRDRTKDKLAELGAGEGVVEFLLAVAEQAATLANVTAEVQGWLDDRNALERFKVGL
ncbi:MAG: hypothetical protein MUC77_07720 [Chromatiaceae bacterium]|nr:hypothetical protein [Chromatiaceae bacterium]